MLKKLVKFIGETESLYPSASARNKLEINRMYVVISEIEQHRGQINYILMTLDYEKRIINGDFNACWFQIHPNHLGCVRGIPEEGEYFEFYRLQEAGYFPPCYEKCRTKADYVEWLGEDLYAVYTKNSVYVLKTF